MKTSLRGILELRRFQMYYIIYNINDSRLPDTLIFCFNYEIVGGGMKISVGITLVMDGPQNMYGKNYKMC